MEKWKDIKNYEGRYQISSTGLVKSLKRPGKRKEILLKQSISKGRNRSEGYFAVVLTKEKTKRTHFIHRLVANSFLEKKSATAQVNHRDGNKLNNAVENLEWIEGKDNILHATRRGLRYSKLTRRQVNSIKKKYAGGKTSQYELAKKYGVNQSVISRVVNLRSWNHG